MVKTKVTQKDIEAIIASSKIERRKMGDKTCVVCLTLPSGFEIVESSSCVHPDNYDEELGASIALGRIKDRIWMLEGYALQLELSSAQ